MKRLWALAAFMLAGCIMNVVPVTPATSSERNYELGRDQSASVGSPIVQVGRIVGAAVYVVTEDFGPRSDVRNPLRRGTEFRVSGREEKSGNLVLVNPSYPYPVVVEPSGMFKGWMINRSFTTVRDLPESPIFVESRVAEQGSMRAEIVYSGIDGTTLLALYREYVDDLARPAFHQELRFDLAESRVIAFRTIRIEVLRATNTAVDYRVIEDGGLPWLSGR